MEHDVSATGGRAPPRRKMLPPSKCRWRGAAPGSHASNKSAQPRLSSDLHHGKHRSRLEVPIYAPTPASGPSFSAAEQIVFHCDPYSCPCSSTIRTARSRNSLGYLPCPGMTPSSSRMGASTKPRGGSVQRTPVGAKLPIRRRILSELLLRESGRIPMGLDGVMLPSLTCPSQGRETMGNDG